MSGEEIKAKIEANNKIIEAVDSTFVLNKEKMAAIRENKELRAQCQHKFENGVCIYCGVEEEEYDCCSIHNTLS